MELDEEAAQNMIKQIMAVWIEPEIQNRKISGKLPDSFELKKAQIIFSGRGKNQVRLNEEAEMKARVTFRAGIKRRIGEDVLDTDIDEISYLSPVNVDTNSAWINLMLFRNYWIVVFDSRYNKKDAREHLERAREFYETAKDALSKERLGPFYDNAFSCAELATKSVLMLFPDKKFIETKSHWLRLERLDSWTTLGNADREFFEKQKRLVSLRASARYLDSNEFENEDPHEYLMVLERMIAWAEQEIGK